MPFPVTSSLLTFSFIGCLSLGILLLVGVSWYQHRRLKRLEHLLSVFLSGKDGQSLETVLLETKSSVRSLDEDIQELFTISNSLHQLGTRSLHKSAVMRFNPFKEVGGNQSFAVALLNGKNSGVVFSSLHTREGTRAYAKPVKNGSADGFPFTEEEKAVIHEAILSAQEKKI
jgi:hypothetical protein